MIRMYVHKKVIMALRYMLKYLDKFGKYAAFIVKDDASLYVLEMCI